jgi:hypothetical protein
MVLLAAKKAGFDALKAGFDALGGLLIAGMAEGVQAVPSHFPNLPHHWLPSVVDDRLARFVSNGHQRDDAGRDLDGGRSAIKLAYDSTLPRPSPFNFPVRDGRNER